MSEGAPGLLLSCCEWGGIVEGRSSSSSSPVRSGMGFFVCPYGPHAGASCICVWGSIGSKVRVHSLVPKSVLSGCRVLRALWLGVGGVGPDLWREGRHISWCAKCLRRRVRFKVTMGCGAFSKSRVHPGSLKIQCKNTPPWATRCGRYENVPGGVRIEQ